MRNLAIKVPQDVWPDFKERARAAYQAPSRAIARDLADGIRADFEADYPSAVACFLDDFEAASPSENAGYPPPSDPDDESAGAAFCRRASSHEDHPNTWGEKPVLKLMFAAMTRAADRWKAIKITEFESRQMTAVRAELDAEYEAQTDLVKTTSEEQHPENYPALYGLDPAFAAAGSLCMARRRSGVKGSGGM